MVLSVCIRLRMGISWDLGLSLHLDNATAEIDYTAQYLLHSTKRREGEARDRLYWAWVRSSFRSGTSSRLV